MAYRIVQIYIAATDSIEEALEVLKPSLAVGREVRIVRDDGIVLTATMELRAAAAWLMEGKNEPGNVH